MENTVTTLRFSDRLKKIQKEKQRSERLRFSRRLSEIQNKKLVLQIPDNKKNKKLVLQIPDNKKLLQIPDNKVGWVISVYDRIELNSGARISLKRLPTPTGYTPVNISGSSTQIDAATKLIDDVISDESIRLVKSQGFSLDNWRFCWPGGDRVVYIEVSSSKADIFSCEFKSIRKRSGGAHLCFQPLGDDPSARIIKLSGSQEQIEVAKQLLVEVQHNVAAGPFQVDVPISKVSCIGRAIRNIQADSGACVSVRLAVSGTNEQIRKAKLVVLKDRSMSIVAGAQKNIKMAAAQNDREVKKKKKRKHEEEEEAEAQSQKKDKKKKKSDD